MAKYEVYLLVLADCSSHVVSSYKQCPILSVCEQVVSSNTCRNHTIDQSLVTSSLDPDVIEEDSRTKDYSMTYSGQR